MEAIRADQLQDLQSLDNEEQNERQLLQKRAAEKVEVFIQSPKGQEALSKAVSKLRDRNLSSDEAYSKAYKFFVDRMVKSEMESVANKFASQKQDMTAKLSRTENEIVEIEEQLKSLGVYSSFCVRFCLLVKMVGLDTLGHSLE